MMRGEYDVLIAGTGAAGLYAALQFDPSVRVLLLAKREPGLSNSNLAQGGVASVLDKRTDDYQHHFDDTMIAGNQKNRREAVDVLVKEGPENVLHIGELGVDFDRKEDGSLDLTMEGGHSRRRIAHHKDSTGHEIVIKLLEQVKKLPNVEIWENTMLFDLQRAQNGFYAAVLRDGKAEIICANDVILATGGIGRVYPYTTNSAIATGDGIALAYWLGAVIKHLSWIQFHPTAFAAEPDRERFLISESVRGEGAVLLNCHKERFMDRYDSRRELAPRDVVSHSIMLEASRTGSEHFYLDISFEDPDFVRNRFPMIYERCLEEGVDMTKDLIPVFPCQHYLMGGIDVDLNARTSIDHLYAAGECSHTGVHGANRLASNSLLEALVFSRRAALDIMARRKAEGAKSVTGPLPTYRLEGGPLPHGYRTEIRSIMQEAHFVIPKPEAVAPGLKRVNEIKEHLEHGGYAITPDWVEARSLATVASIILQEVLDA